MNLELLEDELKAITQAGAYKSKEEAIGHALEVAPSCESSVTVKYRY